jgi:hypothetical protein
LLHALLLVALGGWLLARALQTLMPDTRLSGALAFAGETGNYFALAALLTGALLLSVAMTLPNGRAWAWVGSASAALASLLLVVVAWVASGGSDWAGALLGLVAIVVLGAPSARELYLN